MNRRNFLKSVAIASCAATLPAVTLQAAKNTVPIKPTPKPDLFKLSMAGYTYKHFNIDETLAFMEKIDVHYLCIKDFHLPLNSDEAQIAAFKVKLAAKGVTGYAVGPIYMRSEAEIDRAFAYAKRVGVNMLVGVPNYELLDYTEKKVQEYDIRLAIHLHGPDQTTYPDATDIWNHVKDRDARMGICLDVGHDLRYGQDPVADLKRYHKRVFDMHIKDVTEASKAGKGTPLGRGKVDYPALVKMMRKVGYSGCCSLEYERDMKDPFYGIAESIGYFKAICVAVK